jgi:hypothetical protein
MPAFAKASADEGGLAQLARALALQARGQGFESLILHKVEKIFRFFTYSNVAVKAINIRLFHYCFSIRTDLSVLH